MYKRKFFEEKQVGILYHFTYLYSMLEIIDSDILGDKSLGKYNEISFTRDKNFYKRTKIVPVECCFIVDGNKLSNKYKIKPYQWNSAHFSQHSNNLKSPKSGKIEDQMEEVVYGYISDFNKYVKSIIIFDIDFFTDF